MDRWTPKELRDKKGFGQGETADAIGISRSYFNEIENGERTPSYAMLQKIAGFFGVRIDQIIIPHYESAERAQSKGSVDHSSQATKTA